MAGLKVTLDGVDTISGSRVTIVGEIGRTGLAPGHPLPEPPGSPPGIWGGPIDPYPGHPLPEPPGKPDVPPPTIWPPGPGIDFPAHPIIIPPPVVPGQPPIADGSLITWKAVWTPDTGWMILGHPNVPHPAPS